MRPSRSEKDRTSGGSSKGKKHHRTRNSWRGTCGADSDAGDDAATGWSGDIDELAVSVWERAPPEQPPGAGEVSVGRCVRPGIPLIRFDMIWLEECNRALEEGGRGGRQRREGGGGGGRWWVVDD